MMDDDLDLFHLVPHKMMNFEGKEMPRVRNITLPAPQSYAKRTIATLNKATRQTVVVSDKLDDKQTATIEQFVDTAFEMADDLLASKSFTKVKPFHNSTAALRGGISSRNLVYTNSKGETAIDILPWDMRDVTWETGDDGLEWAACKKKRNTYIASETYNFSHLNQKDNVVITDVWNKEYNEVFVGSELVKEEAHDLGYVPVMIQPASMIPMLTLRGVDSLWKYWGESVFSGSRNLYSKLNDLATLFMSMSAEAYHPAMQKATSDLGEDSAVPQAGEVVNVNPNELYTNMPKRDMYQVQLHIWSILNAELQRATLPYIEYGEIAFELSAVAIAKLGEGRELIFAPIIMALLTGFKQTARMIIDQFVKGGFKGDLGHAGRKLNFTPKQLEGDYDIRFDFHAISPEDNIANFSVASIAKSLNILPDDVILVEILKRSNPAKDKELMMEQRLIEDVPRLRLFKSAHWLLEEGRPVEAKMVADQAGLSFEELTGKQTLAKAKKIKGMPEGRVKTPTAETEILQTQQGARGQRPPERSAVGEEI